MNELLNRLIAKKSERLVRETRKNGVMDYNAYLAILAHLERKQLISIMLDFKTRLDHSAVQFEDYDLEKQVKEELLDLVPEHLHNLFGCPMIALRYDQFVSFLQKNTEMNFSNSSEVFWKFAETFPKKTYFRAIRVKPGTEVDFYNRMLTAPMLQDKFFENDYSTHPPIIGFFEEDFTYHVYSRNTYTSMVSWSENANTAIFAATDQAEEFDPDWYSNPEGTVVLVEIKANSFFFLDETEINKSSPFPPGRESLLIMSLPTKAIEDGGISFTITKKK